MTIKATSADQAKQIFDKLTERGYKHKTSYLFMQEWVNNETGDVVIVGKFYGYKRAKGLY